MNITRDQLHDLASAIAVIESAAEVLREEPDEGWLDMIERNAKAARAVIVEVVKCQSLTPTNS